MNNISDSLYKFPSYRQIRFDHGINTVIAVLKIRIHFYKQDESEGTP